ncbi:MAG: type I secretion system permease/ATPase, partial [Sulfurimonas sp.]
IARALVHKSNILLMDEPSNSMDSTTEAKLMSNLKQEMNGRSFLLVTQKMSMLGLVDRVIVMHQSKVVIDDQKHNVLEKLGGGVKDV